MEKREFLYRLLAEVFIQFREEAVERGDKKTHLLAHIFRNLPMKLFAAETEAEIEEAYRSINDAVASYNIQPWLEEVKTRIGSVE
jgi:hypothetical protein